MDLAELGVQMSYARAARVDRDLAGTSATAGQAHNAVADVAALLTGAGGPGDGRTGGPSTDSADSADSSAEAPPALGPGHAAPDVVLLDGTGVRAGTSKNGVGANLAIGLTGRSGPAGRRRARAHLLGLTVGEDWSMLGAQLEQLPPPALVVVDGEAAITALAQRLWPQAPIQRCWWHLPHGLRKAFYADDAANRHVNPRWARDRASEFGELLREQIRLEHGPAQALDAYDAFTARVPASLLSAHAYLAAAREHTFTCLDPALRARLARLGGPELGTGVLERFMREINARTDIGGVRWSVAGLRDLLTVFAARALHHPSWEAVKRSTHRPNTIQFRLHKFNGA